MTSADSRNTELQRVAELLRADSLDSLELLSSLTDNTICSVQIDSSVPCVTIVWKRYVTSLQLRYIQENAITLLSQHGLRAILGDDTALPTIHAEDQRWLVADWMPRARAAGLVAIANVRPSAPWGQAAVAVVQQGLGQHLDIASFEDRDSARAWLRGMTQP